MTVVVFLVGVLWGIWLGNRWTYTGEDHPGLTCAEAQRVIDWHREAAR